MIFRRNTIFVIVLQLLKLNVLNMCALPKWPILHSIDRSVVQQGAIKQNNVKVWFISNNCLGCPH